MFLNVFLHTIEFWPLIKGKVSYSFRSEKVSQFNDRDFSVILSNSIPVSFAFTKLFKDENDDDVSDRKKSNCN